MQNLLEATDQNIDSVSVNPGTHYFFVYAHELPRIRSKLYAAIDRQGRGEVHTSYNKVKRTLRVVVTL